MPTISESVNKIIADSYVTYAISTLNRALPDAIDGLKVSQRRILQTGLEEGFDRHYAKVAQWGGLTIANYHPHGSVDGTICTMGNEANELCPLVYIYGNNGGYSRNTRQHISNDGPAASRYLKGKLTEFASAIFDMPIGLLSTQPNYTDTKQEVLRYVPALPLLAINGATGIATGYATNMPSYNLKEICQAIREHLLKGTDFAKAVKRNVLGPDLPSGGRILADEALQSAMQIGHGTLRMQGLWEIEQASLTKGKRSKPCTLIKVKALATGSAETFVTQIRDAINGEHIARDLILDVQDLSSGEAGIEVHVYASDEEAGLSALLNCTCLATRFQVNATSLVGNMPKQLGLPAMLELWLDARKAVLLEQAKARLEAIANRLHILQALLQLTTPAVLDKVLGFVRASASTQDASLLLQSALGFSEAQALAILRISIGKLTRLESEALQAEAKQLVQEQGELNARIEQPEVLAKHIADQLARLIKQYGQPRRTLIVKELAEASYGIRRARKPRRRKVRALSPIELMYQQGASLAVPISKRAINKMVEQFKAGQLAEKSLDAAWNAKLQWHCKKHNISLSDARQASLSNSTDPQVVHAELANQCRSKNLPIPRLNSVAKWLASGTEPSKLIADYIAYMEAKQNAN